MADLEGPYCRGRGRGGDVRVEENLKNAYKFISNNMDVFAPAFYLSGNCLYLT